MTPAWRRPWWTGAFLTVTANEDGEEGFATVTVVATDEAGQTATLHFQVEVSPRPPGRWRRLALGDTRTSGATLRCTLPNPLSTGVPACLARAPS